MALKAFLETAIAMESSPPPARCARNPWSVLRTALMGIGAIVLTLPVWGTVTDNIPKLLFFTSFAVTGVALSEFDFKEQRLPDRLTLPLLALGLFASPVIGGSVFWHAAGAALGGAMLYAVAHGYARLQHRQGLGMGDVKLFACCGAWVGVDGVPTVLLLASVSSLVALLIMRFWGRAIHAKTRVPFGPALLFGAWIVLLYGPAELHVF